MDITKSNIVTASDLRLEDLESLKCSPVNLSIYVKALRQGWRQGTVACKDRSEVAFSNKKPWKQKGTGRARAGSLRSPLWRKGGVIFGPQERVRTLKLSKKLKNTVLGNLLAQYLENRKIFSIDWNLESDSPKTSAAFKALKSNNFHNEKIVLFVSPNDHNIHASFANLPNVKMLLFDQPNAYDLADGRAWVFLKKDTDSFKEMVGRWI